MRRCSKNVFFFLLLAAQTFSLPTPTQDHNAEAERFVRRALELIDAATFPCAREVVEAHLDVEIVCARFSGSFSSLKFHFESNLGLLEFTSLAEPLDAWSLRQGIYYRAFKIHDTLATASFNEVTHEIVATYGGPLPAAEPTESSDAEPEEDEQGGDD